MEVVEIVEMVMEAVVVEVVVVFVEVMELEVVVEMMVTYYQ